MKKTDNNFSQIIELVKQKPLEQWEQNYTNTMLLISSVTLGWGLYLLLSDKKKAKQVLTQLDIQRQKWTHFIHFVRLTYQQSSTMIIHVAKQARNDIKEARTIHALYTKDDLVCEEGASIHFKTSKGKVFHQATCIKIQQLTIIPQFYMVAINGKDLTPTEQTFLALGQGYSNSSDWFEDIQQRYKIMDTTTVQLVWWEEPNDVVSKALFNR